MLGICLSKSCSLGKASSRSLARRNSARAFTLIEAMVAVAIFALAITGSISMLVMQNRMIQRTQERRYIAQVLETRLEEIRDIAFGDLGSVSPTFEVKPAVTVFAGKPVNPDFIDEEYERDLTEAQGTIAITDINQDLKKVVVKVVWKSRPRGVSNSMELVSYVARGGAKI